jgi:hypothetical protein
LLGRTQERLQGIERHHVPLGQTVRPNPKLSMDIAQQRLPYGR